MGRNAREFLRTTIYPSAPRRRAFLYILLERVIFAMQEQNKSASRDSLLLTIGLPDSSHSCFHAAMLSFPQGAIQQVMTQLRDTKVLQYIISGLEQDPSRLGEASEWMAGKGCPGVEIAPVDMVGVYHLETDAIQHTIEADDLP